MQECTESLGRYQGGGVFGNATQSPVAITILVKNLNTERSECSINYQDIGGELRGEKKLEELKETVFNLRIQRLAGGQA